MGRRSLNLLGMDPKSLGIEPKHPNPGDSMDRGGTGKGGGTAPFRTFLRPFCYFFGAVPGAGSGPGPALVPGLLRHRSVPKVSPVTMEPKELSLGELRDTLPTWEEMMLLESPRCLHRDLQEFTEELQDTLQRIDDTWRRCNVTSGDGDHVTSLSRALAVYKSTPGAPWDRVTRAASEWQGSVNVLVNSWAWLSRKATEPRDTCRMAVTEAATTRGRELQAEAPRDGTAEEHSVEQGQALGKEEGAEVVAGHEARVRREARVAASEATRVSQQLEAALGPLQRWVAACDEATAFPRELQRLPWDPKATLWGTKKKFPDVPEDKVAEAERLWEASARLARDHLLGMVDDIIDFYNKGDPAIPSARGVAERCQRAMEDIPRLLPPLERPQDVSKVSPVSMELRELSPTLLQPQVTVVATLGELLGTLPRKDEEMLLKSTEHLHRDLQDFTEELRVTLQRIDDTWRRHIVTSGDGDPATSLSQALPAYRSTPGTSRDDMARAASEWQRSVADIIHEKSFLRISERCSFQLQM